MQDTLSTPGVGEKDYVVPVNNCIVGNLIKLLWFPLPALPPSVKDMNR